MPTSERTTSLATTIKLPSGHDNRRVPAMPTGRLPCALRPGANDYVDVRNLLTTHP